MGFARDIMRATLATRREQERRNREAIADEAERQGEPKQARTASPENKMAEKPVPEDKWGPHVAYDPLEGVPWASPQAQVKAINALLSATDFEGETHSGRSGFTADDVARIIAAKSP